MYRSPIEIFMTDIQHQIEQQRDEEIYKAVVSVGINVDKEELIRALRYDRGQYEAGLLEGMAAVKPEWIPVTERLPEPWKWILCYCEAGNIEMLRYDDFMDEWGSVNINRAYKKDYVTHWMPLPEPPKEV